MIDHNTQLQIQAFLDGELTEGEARKIAALIAADRDAAALHAELKHTRRALAGAEAGIQVPETREFYWSKISREIERSESERAPAPVASVWHTLASWLKPIGAVAAVAIVGILAWQQAGSSAAEPIVSAQVDADAITFRDSSTGTTFVWFNYPADNGVAKADGSSTLN